MAQKVLRLLLCDLHEDEVEGQETVPFAVDGNGYEIDLCAQHAKELRGTLVEFVERGRRPASVTRARRIRDRSTAKRGNNAEIRTWAKATGRPVNERGRIPESLVAEYEADQRKSSRK